MVSALIAELRCQPSIRDHDFPQSNEIPLRSAVVCCMSSDFGSFLYMEAVLFQRRKANARVVEMLLSCRNLNTTQQRLEAYKEDFAFVS